MLTAIALLNPEHVATAAIIFGALMGRYIGKKESSGSWHFGWTVWCWVVGALAGAGVVIVFTILWAIIRSLLRWVLTT